LVLVTVATGGVGDALDLGVLGDTLTSSTAAGRVAATARAVAAACTSTCRGLATYSAVAASSAVAKGYAQGEEERATDPSQKAAWGFGVKLLTILDPFSGGVGAGG
jgi:hypothetical protein